MLAYAFSGNLEWRISKICPLGTYHGSLNLTNLNKTSPDLYLLNVGFSEIPFSDVRDKDFHNTIHFQSTPQTQFINVPNKKSKKPMHWFQQLKSLFDQSEKTISCDYYDLNDFQKIKIKQQDFSLLYLNISLLSCHINDLNLM